MLPFDIRHSLFDILRFLRALEKSSEIFPSPLKTEVGPASVSKTTAGCPCWSYPERPDGRATNGASTSAVCRVAVRRCRIAHAQVGATRNPPRATRTPPKEGIKTAAYVRVSSFGGWPQAGVGLMRSRPTADNFGFQEPRKPAAIAVPRCDNPSIWSRQCRRRDVQKACLAHSVSGAARRGLARGAHDRLNSCSP